MDLYVDSELFIYVDSELFNGTEGYERFKEILKDTVKNSNGNPIALVHDNRVVCYLFDPESPLLKGLLAMGKAVPVKVEEIGQTL